MAASSPGWSTRSTAHVPLPPWGPGSGFGVRLVNQPCPRPHASPFLPACDPSATPTSVWGCTGRAQRRQRTDQRARMALDCRDVGLQGLQGLLVGGCRRSWGLSCTEVELRYPACCVDVRWASHSPGRGPVVVCGAGMYSSWPSLGCPAWDAGNQGLPRASCWRAGSRPGLCRPSAATFCPFLGIPPAWGVRISARHC